MSKRGPNQKRRIPKLCFTNTEKIGFYVTFRDPKTNSPRKHRFGIKDKAQIGEAQLAYQKWLAQYLESGPRVPKGRPVQPPPTSSKAAAIQVHVDMAAGSILEVASGFLDALETRVREHGTPRVRGTIAPAVFSDRRKHVRDFLKHVNVVRGAGAVAQLRVDELTMHDVESFNAWAVKEGYSASQVTKRMQMVRSIIDRAGRPEHGGQLLTWNWNSRDVAHGKPTQPRIFPTVEQLIRLLEACGTAHRTMIWLGIGMGFGQRDISALRVGQIDAMGYDLRRSKTGVERYGNTPPLIWQYIQAYLEERPRKTGELFFITRNGAPLVHGRSDSITQWWRKLRVEIGETKDSMGGFYTLRHLGATEFGSRDRCSIGEMRRWLGHSASSQMADVYMRPVSPECREVVEWVRTRLNSTQLDR